MLNEISNINNETPKDGSSKRSKDFTQQFMSHCNDKTNNSKSENRCATCLYHNQKRKTTCDFSCQWKPDIRHFAVQSSLMKMRPEVAETAVQVEPNSFKTNEKETSFLEDLTPNPVVIDMSHSSKIELKQSDTITTQQNLVVNKEELEIGVNQKNISSCLLTDPTDIGEGRDLAKKASSHGTTTSNNDKQEAIDPTNETEQIIQQQQQISEPEQQCFSSTNDNTEQPILNNDQEKVLTQHDGLVELDYSHIPAEILQQILQQNSTATTVAIPKVTVANTFNVESLNEGLKPMYFIVDPASDSYFIPTTTQQVIESVSLIYIQQLFIVLS